MVRRSTPTLYLAMTLLARKCPNCSARFIPWRVWAITRWSCISCPSCGARLNRRMDWQFGILILVGLSALQIVTSILMASTSWPFWVLGLAVFVGIYWLADIATIRLVVAGKPKGLRGYEA